jgi:hypothetical protein
MPKLFLFENECYGNSEPQVVVIDNTEHLLTFVSHREESYIALINVDTGKQELERIPLRIPPGFHSKTYKVE